MSETESAGGTHEVRFQPPDTVLFSITGVLDEAGAISLMSQLVGHVKHLPGYFVIADFTRLQSLTAEARKASVREAQRVNLLSAAIIGASFHVRALTTLIVMGSRLLRSGRSPDIAFVDSELEAQRWLTRQRAASSNRADPPAG